MIYDPETKRNYMFELENNDNKNFFHYPIGRICNTFWFMVRVENNSSCVIDECTLSSNFPKAGVGGGFVFYF